MPNIEDKEWEKYCLEIGKLKRKIRLMKEALVYCANHAHPSIVRDVAKEALKHSK